MKSSGRKANRGSASANAARKESSFLFDRAESLALLITVVRDRRSAGYELAPQRRAPAPRRPASLRSRTTSRVRM